MRVTEESMLRTMLGDITQLSFNQVTIEKQLSSGKKMAAPSDDPGSAQTVLSSYQALRELDQYGVNLETSANWLEASEEAMQSIVDRLTRAKVVAEQMATGTYEEDQQSAVAAEVQNILLDIISLINTQINGNYIFGGTQTQTPPVTLLLAADNPAEAQGGTVAGHDVTAEPLEIALFDYRLQFSRDSGGLASTIAIAANNTLGEFGGLGLNFDAANWTQTQVASDGPPPVGDVWQSNAVTGSVTGPDALVSVRTGETLSFTADGLPQTLRTQCVIDFSGATAGATATVDLDREDPASAPPYPLSYAITGDSDEELAAALAQAINTDPNAECTAWVENGTQVRIMADAGVVLNVTENADPGAVMSIDQDMTMQELSDQLSGGLRSAGVVQFDDLNLPVDIDNLPDPAETVTLGDRTSNWQQIIEEFSDPDIQPPTAAQYAQAFADWVNTYSREDYIAEFSASDTGATVSIRAIVAGDAANATPLASTHAGVTVLTGATLRDGMNGSGGDSGAQLMGLGESSLLMSTEVKVTVTEVNGDSATLRLRWYGDDGQLNTEYVTLPGTGEDNAVQVPGLGGLSIYLTAEQLYAGTEFELQLTHYQGNDEDLFVNFSRGVRMDYNWTGREVLGDYLSVNLLDSVATPLQTRVGMGTVNIEGNYTGIDPRTVTFDVVTPGVSNVPPDSVEFRVRWLTDDGQERVEYLTVDSNTDRVVLPGCDGVEFSLGSGDFQQGDSFRMEIEKNSLHVLDSLASWAYELQYGSKEEAQEESQRALEALDIAIDAVIQHVGTSGTRQERVLSRQGVMEDEELYHSTNLENLQEVDVTEAFLQLTLTQTAYNASLKASSILADLSLVQLIG